MGERDFLTTWSFPDRPAWTARCDTVDRATLSRLGVLRRLVRESPSHRAVLLDGSVGAGEAYADLLAAIAIRRRPRGPRTPVVLVECQWKLGPSRADRFAARLGLLALDGPDVAYCVLSEWERERFAATWGVDTERVHHTPYCHTLSEAELAAPVSRDGGVFAGGNSLRDYRALVSAAVDIPAPVVLATTTVSGPVAGNVAAGPLPHDRYVAELRRASVVVVPLEHRPDRTAGQQTYLNAMALGKPVVVTDSPGVRDYVDDGVTGLIVPPADPAALADAVGWALDPANADAVATLTETAARTARERFSPDRYVKTLLAVADSIA